jgi:hypothetical protein
MLMEDFLRNRVKTVDDVKSLKTQIGSYGGSEKAPFGSSESRREAMALVEKSISKMREVLQPSRPYSDSTMKEFNDILAE